MTNGDEHVAGLRRDGGGGPVVTQFSTQNGEAALARHFDHVSREDLATRAVFPDHAAAEVVACFEAEEPFSPSELPGDLDEAGRLVLVRRLVREGFLRIL